MLIEKLVQTCTACPAQWEFYTTGGRKVYVRYRFGNLTVRISKEATDDVFKCFDGDLLIDEDIGGEWDGNSVVY